MPMDIRKLWADASGEVLTGKALQTLLDMKSMTGVEVHVIQVLAKTDAQGRPVDEAGRLLQPGEVLVPDMATQRTIRTLRLDDENQWRQQIKDLPAYDNWGNPFIYLAREVTAIPGIQTTYTSAVAVSQYTQEGGFVVTPVSALELDQPLKANDQIQVTILDNGVQRAARSFTVDSRQRAPFMLDGYLRVFLPGRNHDQSDRLPKVGDTRVFYESLLDHEQPQEVVLTVRSGDNTRTYQARLGTLHQNATALSIQNSLSGLGAFGIEKIEVSGGTHRLLPGVEFTLKQTSSDYTQKRVTDDLGRLTFTGLSAGDYTLVESKPLDGYLKPTMTWTVHVDSVAVNGVLPVTVRSVVNGQSTLLQPVDGGVIPYYQVENQKIVIPDTGMMAGLSWISLMAGILLIGLSWYIYKINRTKGGDQGE